MIILRDVDGVLTEGGDDITQGQVTWVHDSYTEPREYLLECADCATEIGEWELFTCLDGGESAHVSCVLILKGET